MEDTRVYSLVECLAESIGHCQLITKYFSRMVLAMCCSSWTLVGDKG